MFRRPLIWILGGWILGELFAGWLGLTEAPACSYYPKNDESVSFPLLEQAKSYLRESIRRIAEDEDERGLLLSIVLGDRRELSEESYEELKTGGIAHIVAISGLHLSLLANGVMRLLRLARLGMKASAAAADVFLLLYVIMIGGQVSAWRAFIMFSVQAAAIYAGRTYDQLSALGLAGLLILIRDPMYVWNTAFLLSFSAVFAIGAAAPVLIKWTGTADKPVIKAVLTSLAVQFFTYPVLALYFYYVPLYSLVLNLIIAPLTGLALGGAFVSAAAALVYIPGGVFLGGLSHYLLELILKISSWTSALPGARLVTGRPRAWQMALYYAILFGSLALISHRNAREKRLVIGRPEEELPEDEEDLLALPGGACGGAVIGAASKKRETARSVRIAGGRRGADGTDRDRLTPGQLMLRVSVLAALSLLFLILIRPHRVTPAITALYVGQGDCFVIELPEGRAVIMDCGSSTVDDIAGKKVVPYLLEHRLTEISAVFLSHPDTDHISGVPGLIEESVIDVKRVMIAKRDEASEKYASISAATGGSAEETEIIPLSEGDTVEVSDVAFTVLTCGAQGEADNSGSMVVLLEYNGFKALFTGDMDGTEEGMRKDWPDIDLLKTAHHGSASSTTDGFLAQVKPETALISAGEKNIYGHPSRKVLERLQNAGAVIYCTHELGDITIELGDMREKRDE